MPPSVTVITLGVDDLDAAVRSYDEGLGLPTDEAWPYTMRGTWAPPYGGGDSTSTTDYHWGDHAVDALRALHRACMRVSE